MNNKVLIVLVSIFFMLVFFYVTEKISNYIKVRKNSEKYINKLKKRFDKLMSNKDKEKDYNKKMKNLLMEVKGIVEETRYNNIPLAFFYWTNYLLKNMILDEYIVDFIPEFGEYDEIIKTIVGNMEEGEEKSYDRLDKVRPDLFYFAIHEWIENETNGSVKLFDYDSIEKYYNGITDDKERDCIRNLFNSIINMNLKSY